MAFCGIVAIVVMVVVVTEACDGSPVCDDMHQKIVSILVFCVEPVWPCLSPFFFDTGTVADEMADVRTYPVSV